MHIYLKVARMSNLFVTFLLDLYYCSLPLYPSDQCLYIHLVTCIFHTATDVFLACENTDVLDVIMRAFTRVSFEGADGHSPPLKNPSPPYNVRQVDIIDLLR